MVALDSVKHAALCKMVDYLFEDPETRFPKAMEMVDKAAPRNLSLRNARHSVMQSMRRTTGISCS